MSDPYGYGLGVMVLRAIARRCELHHRASALKTHELEDACGMPRSHLLSPRDPVGSYAVLDAIDCGHAWCTRPRRRERIERALVGLELRVATDGARVEALERLAGPADYAN